MVSSSSRRAFEDADVAVDDEEPLGIESDRRGILIDPDKPPDPRVKLRYAGLVVMINALKSAMVLDYRNIEESSPPHFSTKVQKNTVLRARLNNIRFGEPLSARDPLVCWPVPSESCLWDWKFLRRIPMLDLSPGLLSGRLG